LAAVAHDIQRVGFVQQQANGVQPPACASSAGKCCTESYIQAMLTGRLLSTDLSAPMTLHVMQPALFELRA
jgi:hypothetical protein